MVRDTIMLLLEEDFTMLVAASVAAAIEQLQEDAASQIDLVLLDCLLPDGRVTDVLGEADRLAIPVVLISGDPRQAEMVDPTRRFLAKPFTRETLIAILDSARR